MPSGHSSSSKRSSAAANGPRKLLSMCEHLMQSFDHRKTTVDSHCDVVLGAGKAEGPNAEPAKIFCKQVFYGCVRYKQPLKLFLSSFYYNNAGKTSRNDYTRYMVLGYLALFRLDELGWDRFRGFIMADDPLKMMVLLEYLFDESTLNDFLKPELCKIFDAEFVDNDIISRLLGQMNGASELMESLRIKAYGIAAAAAKAEEEKLLAFKGKGSTVPMPFNLTVPKPRTVKEPMEIVQGVKAMPVPHAMLNRTSVRQIEQEDIVRRKKSHAMTNAKYQGIKREPNLHKTKNTILALRAKVEEERMAPCRVRFRAKPAPKFTADAQVKLTAASILREDNLYKKKQAKEAEVLKKYESELRDTSEFFRWQTEERIKEDAKKLARVEQLRLDMKQSHQNARDAIARNLRKNKINAAEMKVDAEIVLHNMEKNIIADTKKKQRLAKEIAKVRDSAPGRSKKKIHAANQKKRIQLKKEIEIRIERQEKEDEIEQERRNDMIRQIRAIERVPKLKAKMFDPTTSSNMGLLQEMSLVELRERLRMVHAQKEEEVVEKRKAIMRLKQSKEHKLKARLDNIRRVRRMSTVEAKKQRRRTKELEHEQVLREKKVTDQAVKEVARRLDIKRDEKQKELDELLEAEEKIAKKRQFLGAAAAMVEEKKFEDLLSGASREARIRQRDAKHEKVVEEKTDSRTRKQRISNVKQRQKTEFEKDEDEKANLIVRKKEIAEREYQETLDKKARVKNVQQWEREHTTYLRTINEYATDVNDTLLAKARGQKRVDMNTTRDERIMNQRSAVLEETSQKYTRRKKGEPATGFKTTRFAHK